MPHYPISIDLLNRRCLVVGGGHIALRKIQTLIEYGASVTVVSPDLIPEISALVRSGGVSYSRSPYIADQLDGAFLVVAATDHRETNQAVSDDAQRMGILVNVVDDPTLCSFIVPAISRQGDLTIAVSTSGNSPALAGYLRDRIESCIGPEYGDLAELLGELRDEIKMKYDLPSDRKKVFLRIIECESVLESLAEGDRDAAVRKARTCI